MRDLELRKIGDVRMAENNLFNFGIEQYLSKFDVQKEIALNKTIVGITLEIDDDIKSIINILDLAIQSGASIVIFDAVTATGFQMMNIRNYFAKRYPMFEEISNMFELRIVFATKNNSFAHI